ncbi:Uncharacterised protein [Mycobacteroides abscessus subsp. abscessus]|nr:Uncharacterised protein [Mycobacteroides abscessus subsp. abscessus]
MLGGHVVRDPDQPAQPGNGADQYQCAAAAGDQVWCGYPGGMPDAGQVDIKHCLPVAFGHLQHHAARGYAGGGAHDIQATERVDRVVGEGPQIAEPAHIHHTGNDPPSRRFDQFGCLVQIAAGGRRRDGGVYRGADVEGDDVGALLCEAHCLGPSDTPGCARHQGHLARQSSSHVMPSASVRRRPPIGFR